MKLWFVVALLVFSCGVCFGQNGLDAKSMVVGDKVLEFVETNPLTSKADGAIRSASISPDGKYVAYVAKPGDDEVIRVVRTDGGRPVTALKPDQRILPTKEIPEGFEETWLMMGDALRPRPRFVSSLWSPDSKLFVVSAICRLEKPAPKTSDDAKNEEAEDDFEQRDYMLVFDNTGQLIRVFQWPDGQSMGILGGVLWSNDCHSFVCTAEVFSDNSLDGTSIVRFDVSDGSMRTISPPRVEIIHLFGWSHGGSAILFSAPSFPAAMKSAPLKECELDNGAERVAFTGSSYGLSPDAKRRVVADKVKWNLEDVTTHKVSSLFKDKTAWFCSWTQDARLVLFSRDATSKDLNAARSARYREYWLVSPEAHGFNHLCVIPNTDDFIYPSASRDGLAIAYVSDGRLWVATCGYRDPSCWEKLAAGLALSEEESQEILLERAGTICKALRPITESEDSPLPDETELRDKVKKDLEGSDKTNFFLRPGKLTNAFTYDPPEKVDDAEKTVVGYLDAGYSWKVNIYADGHAELVDKK